MAYGKRKRSFKKRPSFRRKRVAYRKVRKMRRFGPGKSIGQKTITVRMRYPDATLTTSTLVNLLGNFTFQPDQLLNFNLFSAIFDSFHVNKVTWSLQFPITQLTIPADDVTGVASKRLSFYTCLDPDSPGQTLGTVEDVQAYANCKTTTVPRTHIRSWVPKMYGTVRRSSISNAFVPVPQSKFMDNATADLELSPTLCYGMINTPIAYQLTAKVTAWITFRCIRNQ